jgi:hypothetical protein
MKRLIAMIFSSIVIFSFASAVFATKLTIQFKDGRSETYDASQINAIFLSEDGQSGSFTGAGISTIDGVWSTKDAGDVTYRQTGSQVIGRYATDNGEITGTVIGKTFDGFWIEDASATKCGYPRNGRYYWGKLRFDVQGNRQTGSWGYCDENPSRPWEGTKK